MRRRELLVILGAAAVAWPLGVQAQQQAKGLARRFSGNTPTPRRSRVQPILRLPEACGNSAMSKVTTW